MRRNSIQTSGLEMEILKRVRASNGISRVQVARDLGLAPSTSGVYVERLVADGFLLETEVTARTTGRPPRLLRTNPEGGEFIGVDFEARNIMAVAVDFADQPLRNARRRIDPADSISVIIAKIADVIGEVLPKTSSRLLAIGIGVPGTVDARRGVALRYKYIAHWQDVQLAARIREKFAVPVFLENTVRAMALAELWFGQGRNERDFVCLGIRSGLGAGIVADGRLYRGARFTAGEIGRWQVPSDGRTAQSWFSAVRDAGPEGPELQDIASARAIENALRDAVASGKKSLLRRGRAGFSFSDITHAAQQRDALTLRVVAEAATALGVAVGHLALTLNPAKVILTGPLTQLGETFLAPLRAEVERRLEASGTGAPIIVNSTMGEFSGALGAAALALHEWKPAQPDVTALTRKQRRRKVAR